MNSINELRLLSTGPVSLADPGRLAAKAATPGPAAQTAEAVVPTAATPRPAPEAAAPQNSAPGAPGAPEASANATSESARIHQRFARFEAMDYAD